MNSYNRGSAVEQWWQSKPPTALAFAVSIIILVSCAIRSVMPLDGHVFTTLQALDNALELTPPSQLAPAYASAALTARMYDNMYQAAAPSRVTGGTLRRLMCRLAVADDAVSRVGNASVISAHDMLLSLGHALHASCATWRRVLQQECDAAGDALGSCRVVVDARIDVAARALIPDGRVYAHIPAAPPRARQGGVAEQPAESVVRFSVRERDVWTSAIRRVLADAASRPMTTSAARTPRAPELLLQPHVVVVFIVPAAVYTPLMIVDERERGAADARSWSCRAAGDEASRPEAHCVAILNERADASTAPTAAPDADALRELLATASRRATAAAVAVPLPRALLQDALLWHAVSPAHARRADVAAVLDEYVAPVKLMCVFLPAFAPAVAPTMAAALGAMRRAVSAGRSRAQRRWR